LLTPSWSQTPWPRALGERDDSDELYVGLGCFRIEGCAGRRSALSGRRQLFLYARRMCIICVELAKQAMTPTEARRALGEMRVKLDSEHIAEVEKKLSQAEKATAQKP
jgi:hypothetical protein